MNKEKILNESKDARTSNNQGVDLQRLVRQNFQLGEKVFYLWVRHTGKYHEIKNKRQEVIGPVFIKAAKLSYGNIYYNFGDKEQMSQERIFRNKEEALILVDKLNARNHVTDLPNKLIQAELRDCL